MNFFSLIPAPSAYLSPRSLSDIFTVGLLRGGVGADVSASSWLTCLFPFQFLENNVT